MCLILNNTTLKTMSTSLYTERRVSTSIGPIGFIGPSASSRLKGIMPGVVSTPDLLDSHLCALRAGIAQLTLEPQRRMPLFKDKSRISVRIIATDPMLKQLRRRLRERAYSEVATEAVLHFRDPNNRPLTMVYLAYNDGSRRIEPAQLTAHYKKIAGFYHETRADAQNIREILLGVMRKGYTTTTFNGSESIDAAARLGIDVQGMADLLRFTYKEYDITSAYNVITNSNNTVAVAVKEGLVVGMSILERATFKMEGGIIRFAEVTDGMVMAGHHGNGLYRATTADLLANIDPRENQLVFAEATLAHDAVPKAFATFNARLAGVLAKHLHIGGRLTSFAVMQMEPDVFDNLRELKWKTQVPY